MNSSSKSNHDEALIVTLLELPVVTVAAMIQWVKDHAEDVAISLSGQKMYIVADNSTLKEFADAFNRRFGMLAERYTLELP